MFTQQQLVVVQESVANWRSLLIVKLVCLAVGSMRTQSGVAAEPGNSTEVRRMATADGVGSNSFYVGNRAPLASSPFVKLPIGSIQPMGWLRHMLELQRDGMVGRLAEISPWLDRDHSAWARRDGSGRMGWEELPYWLKGYGDLGYVLHDETMQAEAKWWIESAIASQREDGWFGPRELLTSLHGKPDLWPHMVMLNVMQSYHEATGDPRVIELMRRYMRWEDRLPESAFGEGYWPKLRAGDNIESVFWLYNRTGDPWLLDLARKIHAGMARWDERIVDWHNVNLAQGFRAGTVAWMLTGEPRHLESAERNYSALVGEYGQFPGGGFVGDENCRPGFVDPRGGIETCGIVEFMHSFELLTRITGNPVWSDRCEEIALNSFTASMTPDHRGLHYITSANQVQLDRLNKSPGIQNGGTMFSYSPFEVYRCCQHNVSHGWPYYAEELWLATPDNGLCASLYAPCEVTARVGSGVDVKITETTEYPFGESVEFRIALDQPTKFPLHVRIPGWCAEASVEINGVRAPVSGSAPCYGVISRVWSDGDLVRLSLPMKVALRTWEANHRSVSVNRGPLSYSLAIDERWEKYGDRDPRWPEWEVYSQSPWNFGLEINPQEPEGSFKFERRPGPVPDQPFTPDSVPVRIRGMGREIANWKLDHRGMVGALQPSPAFSDAPLQELTLIPMGAARLRITAFPTVTDSADGHKWVAPELPHESKYVVSASHCFENDSVDAVGDGLEPRNSADESIPRMTWWPHQGTTEWIQYDFGAPRRLSATAVYWFDDTPAGACALPKAWRVLYRDGDEWRPVSGVKMSPIGKDKYNQMAFDAVTTTALRLEVDLQPDRSAGILEWSLSE
ncbi:MAG: glycoside hydrolase family 127 protein [Pirellulales bacterium]